METPAPFFNLEDLDRPKLPSRREARIIRQERFEPYPTQTSEPKTQNEHGNSLSIGKARKLTMQSRGSSDTLLRVMRRLNRQNNPELDSIDADMKIRKLEEERLRKQHMDLSKMYSVEPPGAPKIQRTYNATEFTPGKTEVVPKKKMPDRELLTASSDVPSLSFTQTSKPSKRSQTFTRGEPEDNFSSFPSFNQINTDKIVKEISQKKQDSSEVESNKKKNTSSKKTSDRTKVEKNSSHTKKKREKSSAKKTEVLPDEI